MKNLIIFILVQVAIIGIILYFTQASKPIKPEECNTLTLTSYSIEKGKSFSFSARTNDTLSLISDGNSYKIYGAAANVNGYGINDLIDILPNNILHITYNSRYQFVDLRIQDLVVYTIDDYNKANSQSLEEFKLAAVLIESVYFIVLALYLWIFALDEWRKNIRRLHRRLKRKNSKNPTR